MSDPILDVDLGTFETGSDADRAAVVDGVMRSLATGFVYVSTDLSEDLLDEAYGLLRAFFELPAETKERWVAPGTNGQAGYTGLLVETAATADAPDWKEMLNWGNSLPDGHPLRKRFPHRYAEPVLPEADVPGIGRALLEFHDRVHDVQRRFLRIIAVGLGCHPDVFEDMLRNGTTLNRAIRYPPMRQAPGAAHEWAGAHGDINIITALPRATDRGLQVQTEQGWVDAAPPDGHVIINTGIMLERLTNGQIPIGWHRVVAAPGYEGERHSVVQFCHPRPWTILSPVPSCCTADHPQRFAAVSAADALDEVLYEINLVEDARRV
jgi:isopenicillin N synthase-like dioxygenase